MISLNVQTVNTSKSNSVSIDVMSTRTRPIVAFDIAQKKKRYSRIRFSNNTFI